MFIRYGRTPGGKPVAKAYVYTSREHGIDMRKIDPDAVRIVEKLKSAGCQAYIVGGAVRDLLLGRAPKDFDLVTDAVPARIRKICRNSRIIGKRFKLVHIYAGGKIFEVSTFRSNRNGSVGNEFGSMDEDVSRRDFTMNALYYDPTEQLLVDYIGGYSDIKAGKIKPIIPLDRIFKEDPVRMVRGVKYAITSGFAMPFTLRRVIKKEAELLGQTSPSRRTEEFFKILASGSSEPIIRSLCDFRMYEYFVPESWRLMQENPGYADRLFADLRELDIVPQRETAETGVPEAEAGEGGEGGEEAAILDRRRISVMLSFFLHSFVALDREKLFATPESYREALSAARGFLSPLNPPRVELEAALLMIFRKLGISPLQKPARPRRRRRREPAAAEAPTALPGAAPAKPGRSGRRPPGHT